MVRKIKSKVKKALKGDNVTKSNSSTGNKGQTPSRLQHKLLKKVAFLDKISSNIPKSSGVQKKKRRRPSIALSDFSSLAEGLQQAIKDGSKVKSGSKQPGSAVGTLKARKNIMHEESKRLQQVINHPQFQADPLAAIKQHLIATLPPPPEPPKPKMSEEQKKAARKLKKKMSKANKAEREMKE